MDPNPVLRRLGFANTDRLAIIHTDDIGMCLASVEAFAGLWDFGLISSGAVMVPCPWFLKAAAYAREHPQADLGVHTTLTSEWQYYRWGPISTRDPESGMVDAEGYFYHLAGPAREHGDPGCVEKEIEAQVERAIAMGMHPTHIDTHMGVVATPRFMLGYLKTGLRYGLLPMIYRMEKAGWLATGMDDATAELAMQVSTLLEGIGLPLLDHIRSLKLEQPEHRLEQAKAAFSALQPGITHFIIHPAKDMPELREITPDWQARVADYQTFMNEELRRHIQSTGVHVIGYRHLQALMPDPAVLQALPF